MSDTAETYCGFVAILGRPNVGKSTLTNCLIGEKISITTRKPQTTRNNIMGIHTDGNHQYVFVDTPGIHKKQVTALNKKMNKAAVSATTDVDAILFMVDACKWTNDDEFTLSKIVNKKVPTILIINKIDTIKDKSQLLKHIEFLSEKHTFKSVIPVSAMKKDGCNKLLSQLKELMPASPFYFPVEQKTDRNLSFRVSEVVREKLFFNLGDELPYSLTVITEKLEDSERLLKIHALIMVEREGQKKIVVGQNGSILKKVGKAAREELENLVGKKIYLALWVKVKDKWSDNDKLLKQFGYGES